MKLAKIEDVSGYARDMSNRAIVSTNNNAVLAYKKRREKEITMQQAIEDINSVKTELQDIKLLLTQLIQNRS